MQTMSCWVGDNEAAAVAGNSTMSLFKFDAVETLGKTLWHGLGSVGVEIVRHAQIDLRTS